MKIRDKVNLITASGEEHTGIVVKIFPKDILTLTIVRPNGGGITQKYHKVPKVPKKPKPNTAYWTEVKTKKSESVKIVASSTASEVVSTIPTSS